MVPLYILGTSGFAKEVAQLATQINNSNLTWSSINYLSERREDIGKVLAYGRVIATDEMLDNLENQTDVAIGVGHPEIRKRLAEKISKTPLINTPNLIYPGLDIDPDYVQIGKGNFFARGVSITCDIKVGNFNLFNYNCTIGHDVLIGSYNVICPSSNISGYCTIGNECLVGTGSQILPSTKVADRSIIGASSLLTESITNEGHTFIGIPARKLKK
jgi:sugar O-acyltransferase (sialic acid O-acetyltransferase NeuD family)